jgi:hypothetical protein
MFGRFRTRARLQEARHPARKLRNIPSELDPPRFPHRAIKFVARFAIPFLGAENRANGSVDLSAWEFNPGIRRNGVTTCRNEGDGGDLGTRRSPSPRPSSPSRPYSRIKDHPTPRNVPSAGPAYPPRHGFPEDDDIVQFSVSSAVLPTARLGTRLHFPPLYASVTGWRKGIRL